MLFKSLFCIVLILIIADLSVLLLVGVKLYGKMDNLEGLRKSTTISKVKTPKQYLQKRKVDADIRKYQETMGKIIDNVDKYDGTPIGQKEIKWK